MQRQLTRRVSRILLALLAASASAIRASPPTASGQSEQPPPSATYLGFDANSYPGDSTLPALRRTFSFTGYWLNAPPDAKSNLWIGKRTVLLQNGFGFLVLFNGRLERELKSIARAQTLGSSDARSAVDAALDEGFHPGTIIFLDQEEGGRMEPDQMSYIAAWVDGVIASGFRAGIYCSGMPASEGRGQFVVAATDIRNHLPGRTVLFFIYNDACPPAPGCRIATAPNPKDSGVDFASVWQFAQSPRRKEFTNRCVATYNLDGNCYAPAEAALAGMLDLDSATSPDPSGGKRVLQPANEHEDVADNH